LNLPRILFQFDTDLQASAFDAVVAIDSQIDHLLQYAAVNESNVVGLVHGTMFTRAPDQLRNTAIFVGGSNIAAGEQLVARIKQTFFGPMRVSVMLDSNGANTTAAAAVLSAERHISLKERLTLVLGGTGPVGQRVARLVLSQGGRVVLASRTLDKAQAACEAIRQQIGSTKFSLQPLAMQDSQQFSSILESAEVLFSCGAAGVNMVNAQTLLLAKNLKVAIDLSAVPPAGIEGISVMDKAVVRGDRIDYGAVGVGGLKMKIHRGAIGSLFESNDRVLDVQEIYQAGKSL
jgi:methylenetetrahydrofolate/methylenetetrahydromethanopterin dehydrogenase (NADP+)